MNCLAALILLTMTAASVAQQEEVFDQIPVGNLAVELQREPLKDFTYQIQWLIESDDLNRRPYDGPAREGLAQLGFGRLVKAGSLASSVTVGQKSVVTGGSRYGALTASLSILNTIDKGAIQIKIDLQTKAKTPTVIDTTVRIPLSRWVLLGAADSRVALPFDADDGRRGVLIMRVIDGVQLLD